MGHKYLNHIQALQDDKIGKLPNLSLSFQINNSLSYRLKNIPSKI